MRFGKPIGFLVTLVAVLSLVAAGYGVLSRGGPGRHTIVSWRGQPVDIHGTGLYRNDSVSVATQAVSQDVVTVLLGIPLLVSSGVVAMKGSLRARLLLAGTMGYFLYAYASYSFLSMYNEFFLVYVALFSASLAAFVLAMMSLDVKEIEDAIGDRFPRRFTGSFLLILALIVAAMWLGRIIPPLRSGTIPAGLEHYTTLVIQALDLGIVAPLAIVSSVLVFRKSAYGYMLASVVVMKGITMLTAVTAMVVGLLVAREAVSPAEVVVFPLFNAIAIYTMVLILRSVRATYR